MSDPSDIVMHITDLRGGATYLSTMRRVHDAPPAELERWAQTETSADYARLRHAIGTWELIADTVFQSGIEYRPVFVCTPVGLIWDVLAPAIRQIRRCEDLPRYAGKFENLAAAYNIWCETPEGQTFTSPAQAALV